jgi:hypothetical protein
MIGMGRFSLVPNGVARRLFLVQLDGARGVDVFVGDGLDGHGGGSG